MRKMTKVRALLGVSAVLVFLAFVAGCGLVSGQDQALKEKKKTEELQKKLDAQEQKEKQQKEEKEAARQEELEKQVEDLQEKVEDQEKEEKQTSDPSGDVSDEDIQNLNTSPSQAPEGVVVVSPDFNAGAATAEEAAAINGAIDYYQYAEIGDYYTTYDLLSSEDQAYYTQDEWVTANTVLET